VALPFSAALTAAKNQHHSGDPLIWLYRIDVDGTPANDLRLSNYYRDINYDQGDGSGSKTFTASSLKLGDVSEREGTLQDVSVSVENVTRDAANRLLAGEIIDRRVTIMLVSLASLLSAGHHDVLAYVARRATITERAVTFTLGQFPYFSFMFPGDRYVPDRCRYVHEGTVNPAFDGRCGAVAILTTCDKSLAGAAGCAGNANQVRTGVFSDMLIGTHPLL